jgi:hypothetical protein
LEPFDSASRIWHDYLSDRERRELGNNLEQAFRRYGGTLGMVGHARKCSEIESLLWLCEQLGTLPAARLQSLRKELGLPKKSVRSRYASHIPRWDRIRGELLLGERVVRKIRSTKIAHRAVAILDAFEQCDWCECIQNPLKSGDPHEMRDAVYSLNNGLEQIRFKCDGTGTGIIWERP